MVSSFLKKVFGTSTDTKVAIPQITGPRTFDIEVVGESHYQAHFEKICGPRCAAGEKKEIRAKLILDNNNKFDSQAVRVEIHGGLVGYLPKPTARDFRRAVIEGGLADFQAFECAGLIRGGWDKGGGIIGHYGLWLDLPQDDD